MTSAFVKVPFLFQSAALERATSQVALSMWQRSGGIFSRASPIEVKFRIENTGKVAGAEVPQIYLEFPKSTGEPPKRLVAFEKVWLRPGQSQVVEVTVDPAGSSHPFGVFDSSAQKWKTVDGAYKVMVGTSSANIAFSESVSIQ